MIRPVPPVGVPDEIEYKGRTYAFDCVGGTGDPIYQYVKDSGERFHVIVVDGRAHDSRGYDPGRDALPTQLRRRVGQSN